MQMQRRQRRKRWTAATAAKVASDAAQTARENLATLQTGQKSGDLAHTAYMQAKAAADAAADAQTASDAAAEATDSGAATRFLVMAETARDNAVTAQGIAETQGAAAETAAMAELMIVGTVKTVGGTSLDATAGSSVVVTGEDADAQTVRTGLIKRMNPMTTGPGVPDDDAAGFVQAMPDDDPVVVGVAHKQAVAPRTFAIGKLVDSADDLARLMIVTQYAGTNSVKVYADLGGTDLTGSVGSDGRIDTTPETTTDDDVCHPQVCRHVLPRRRCRSWRRTYSRRILSVTRPRARRCSPMWMMTTIQSTWCSHQRR